jgi:hypothetical protein
MSLLGVCFFSSLKVARRRVLGSSTLVAGFGLIGFG